MLQDCLQRVDDAFQRFFQGEAGYPHFKSKDRSSPLPTLNPER
ncbi:hypothetical protein [Microaerobacter geothermalis]|nr:hypothetical protein [Microaerobacter geothermalis]